MEIKNKLTIHETPFGHPMHSDVYCLKTEANLPTVLFFGGSVSREVYHLRSMSFPENLFSCFKTEFSDVPAKLITIPCPYGQIEHDDGAIECMQNVLLDFLKQSNTAPHSIRAIIGNSRGSFWAVGVAPYFTQAKTLITIAGAGMNSALKEVPRKQHPESVHCFANDNDPLRNMTLAFADSLQKAGVTHSLTTRPGGHSFSDYEKNGSASEAFQKAAEACR